MELCEKDLKEYPNDWVMRLQLAIEYEIRQENEKALYHYKCFHYMDLVYYKL